MSSFRKIHSPVDSFEKTSRDPQFLHPSSASKTFEILVTMVVIFFIKEFIPIGETLSPLNNLLLGENEALYELRVAASS